MAGVPAHQYYREHRSEFMGEGGHEALLERLRAHIQPTSGRLVLLADVGAGSGKYLPRLASLAPEDHALILGFEPNPLNHPLLRRVSVGRPLRLFTCALSDRPGRQTLSTIIDAPENRPGYTLASLRGDGEAIAEVRVETFDDVVEGMRLEDFVIRFVKIDTEGNDTRVIRGMERQLPRVRYLVFESSDCLDDRRGPGEDRPLRNIVEYLDQHGFDTWKLGTKRMLKLNGEGWHPVYEDDKFHSNSFAIRKDDPVIDRLCDSHGALKPVQA